MKSKIKQKFPQIDKLQGRPPVTTLKKIANLQTLFLHCQFQKIIFHSA